MATVLHAVVYFCGGKDFWSRTFIKTSFQCLELTVCCIRLFKTGLINLKRHMKEDRQRCPEEIIKHAAVSHMEAMM